VHWDEVEVIRAIYGAVRDRNWGTVPARIERLEMDCSAERTGIRFKAVCSEGTIRYEYEASIVVSAGGELRFEFAGEARSDFLRNRIGLCVLHPIDLCAGAECEVEHSDGGLEHG